MRYEIVTVTGETVGTFRRAAAVMLECSAIFEEQGGAGEILIRRWKDGSFLVDHFTYPAADNNALRKRMEAE